MNIFVLSLDPVEAAIQQCDKHVVKMVLESGQLLSGAHRFFNSSVQDFVYRASKSQLNHPCAKWVRESAYNYIWLYEHMLALGEEYTRRYGKVHKTIRERSKYLAGLPPHLDFTPATQHPLCMPDKYKIYDDCDNADVVGSYRAFYIGDKAYFARWKLGNQPDWWPSDVEK
jgi:hypothetical protein